MENKRTILCKVELIEGGDFYFRDTIENEVYANKSYDQKYEIEISIIGKLINILARVFLSVMKGKFILENTININLISYDSDTYQAKIDEITNKKTNNFMLGSYPNYARIGYNVFSMSRSHFHFLQNSDDRLKYIADRMFLSLFEYCEYFKQDYSPVVEAYEEIKAFKDWYLPKEGGIKSINKQGTHKAWLQVLYGYEKDNFRLVIQSISSLEKHFFFVTNKDPWIKIYIENNIAEAYLKGESENVPTIGFEIIGWKKKGRAFQFKWGEEEFYEFSLDTMELIKK